MKESSFIKKNLNSWSEYEKISSLKEGNPRKLSKLFVKVTDDLSYAYTYYKNRSVRIYLNSISKALFNSINHSERFHISSAKKFFSITVPLSIYHARKECYIAFAVFVLSMLIGVLSSKYDPEFAQLILGEDYIEMTQTNIAENDPMAVYKSQGSFDMFFSITLNNCLVALRTFVFGFFMAIGTLLVLLYNGIMVGAFQYFFVEQGLFKESFLTIWQHGVFEISSIIMSGAAGLVLGKGLVFPGNYSRFQALRISARRGLKLMLGILPILVIAAFIEGFYTRYTDASDILRVITILLSLVAIIGYFIILPRRRGLEYKTDIQLNNNLESTDNTKLHLDKIYKDSEIFMLTLQQLKANFGKILRWAFVTALILPIGIYLLESFEITKLYFGSPSFRPMEIIHLNYFGIAILILSITIVSGLLSIHQIQSEVPKAKRQPRSIIFYLQVFIMIVLVHIPLNLRSPFFSVLFYLVCLLYSTLVLNILAIENVGLVRAFQLSFRYLKGSFPKFFYLLIRFSVLGTLLYLIFDKLILSLNTELIQMNLYGSSETSDKIFFYVNALYFSFVLIIVFSIVFLGNKILYFSLFETIYAKSLQAKINLIGKTNRIRGLIRE